MKKNNLMIFCLLVLGAALSLSTFAATSQPIIIKAGTAINIDAPYNQALIYFVSELNKRFPGRFKLDLYPSSQLGGERDLVEGVQLGTIQMTMVSTGPLAAFVPDIKLVNLPYLFKSSAHAYKVLDGPIGQGILDQFKAKGIIALTFAENGWRHVSNNKRPVKSPKDLKGLKIRVMEDPIMVASLNAMGATAVAMGWPEVITSIEQGVLDGQENPIINFVENGTVPVQKYLSLTGHFYNPAVLMVNAAFFQSQPVEVQKAFYEVAIKTRDFERNFIKDKEKSYLKFIKEHCEVVEKPDINAFRKSVAPVYDQFAEQCGGWDLIKKVQNM